MNERALLLGKTKSLVGVLTEPVRNSPAHNRPAVILLNAGLVHRVGPNRMNVQIARRLAASGFPVLRFDLAGIGDSPNRTDELSLRDGVVSDARAVMDFLVRETGAQRFILVGLCSGANNSLRIAQRDNRVIGAVPIEPYHTSTPAYHFYYYSRRLLDPRCWRRALTLKSDFWRLIGNYWSRAVRSPQGDGRSQSAGPAGGRTSKSEMISEVEALLRRGVSLHFIYCVDSPSYYNHYLPLRAKAASWKPFRATLFDNTDHTFTLLSGQQSLVEAIDDWVKNFAVGEQVRSSRVQC